MRNSCLLCITYRETDLKTAAGLATQRPKVLNDPMLDRRHVLLARSTA